MQTFLIEGNGAASEAKEKATSPKPPAKPSKKKATTKKPSKPAATKPAATKPTPKVAASATKRKSATRSSAKPLPRKKAAKDSDKNKIVITAKDVKQAPTADPEVRASDVASETKPKSKHTPVSLRAKPEPAKKQEAPKPARPSTSKKKNRWRNEDPDAPEPAPQPVQPSAPKPVVEQRPTEPRPPKPVPALQSFEDADDFEKVHGVEHDATKLWIAYTLAISLAVIGILNLVPAIFEFMRSQDPTQAAIPIQRWSYALLCVGAVQLFYAVYLSQLPDWSSVWVVAILTLIVATGYAMLFGIIWLGKDDSMIINVLGLPQHLRDEARLWCFSMLSATGLLTYFCGREGMRWHKIYRMQSDVAGS